MDMASKVKELRELRRMAEELQGEIDALTDSLKAELTARETDELAGTDWKVSWKSISTSRFDAKAFKTDHTELYDQYIKATTVRRFCVV